MGLILKFDFESGSLVMKNHTSNAQQENATKLEQSNLLIENYFSVSFFNNFFLLHSKITFSKLLDGIRIFKMAINSVNTSLINKINEYYLC